MVQASIGRIREKLVRVDERPNDLEQIMREFIDEMKLYELKWQLLNEEPDKLGLNPAELVKTLEQTFKGFIQQLYRREGRNSMKTIKTKVERAISLNSGSLSIKKFVSFVEGQNEQLFGEIGPSDYQHLKDMHLEESRFWFLYYLLTEKKISA